MISFEVQRTECTMYRNWRHRIPNLDLFQTPINKTLHDTCYIQIHQLRLNQDLGKQYVLHGNAKTLSDKRRNNIFRCKRIQDKLTTHENMISFGITTRT
jgi:hypothetical protein